MNLSRGPAGSMSGQKMAGYDVVQQSNFTPDQMKLFQQLFQHVQPGSFLNQLASGDEGMFQQMEAPGYRQLNQNLGDLASRFSGMGLGARRGSGFQNQSTQAVSDFTQDMLARRQTLQREAIADLLGFSNQLLKQRPYDEFFIKPQPKRSFWESILGGVAPVAGAAIGGYMGGVPGAQLGATVGQSASQGFFGGQ